MSNNDVTISGDAAEEALIALRREIEQTDGDDVYNEPIVEAIERVKDSDELSDYTTLRTLEILVAVAEERGVDPNGTDPIVSRTIEARKELAEVLGKKNERHIPDDQTTLP